MIEPPSYASAIAKPPPQTIPTTPQSQISGPSAGSRRQYGGHTPDTFESTAKERSSLDFTQRLERRLAEYDASENIFKRWWFEIASWTISALCMGAIVGIYIRLNGMTMARSGTLLTLANILGKVASAALIIPISEALGQLKWNWFHNSNAIWDFELFDKASRGAWGAALLLFRTKGRSLAALGALLILLLLAIDTFFQQVVVFPDKQTLHATRGEIPRVVYYDPIYLPAFTGGFETSPINTDTAPIVEQFFYSNGTQPLSFGTGVRPEVPLSCPTSSCHWAAYETLAVCSKCMEVSHLINITFACMNTTVDWSSKWLGPVPLSGNPFPSGTVCGHFLNATTDRPILLSGYSVNETGGSDTDEALLFRTTPLTRFLTKERLYGVGSVAFKHIRNPILDALVSAVEGPESAYQNKTPTVHECVLLWCVQTIESSYDLGTYREEVLSSYHNTTIGPSPWVSWDIPKEEGGGVWVEYTENVNIKRPQANPDTNSTIFDLEYGANNVTASTFMNIFDDFFPATYTVDNISATPRLRYKNYPDAPSQRYLTWSPWLASNNITNYMERLATAMTNKVRSLTTSNQMLKGEAFYTEKYVQIQWEWLTFPLLLLILSLVFLASTIIKTSKDTSTGIWKTSAMPTLIYSLPKETQSQFTSSSAFTKAEHNNNVRIRLSMKTGWRVSGQNPLSRSPQLPRPAHQAPDGWI
jgi:hypothetical protein